jgi:phosphoserine phosphatase
MSRVWVPGEGLLLSDRPLVVDLDGTLILTDMLHESALKLLRERPLSALQMPFQLAAGKAQLKQYIARHTELSAETLPYNTNFLQWLREERGRGRELILCTASDQKFAQQVADHLDLFDHVMASDGSTNLKGEQKARDLVQRFGRGNFDYAGNSRADLPIWECAAEATIPKEKKASTSSSNAPGSVRRWAASIGANNNRFFSHC